ncbi:hypothetical protein Nepgr_012607 [Nepenthes gracilis]|uniref:Uncharacterized protein n=1 Tax=Nepenthes gracilis TaxID=150966 RepID=A0AAD3SHU1_NEPGR|nr:hypothetical protein Nepgr_012607 [Nepenthes gracilis]
MHAAEKRPDQGQAMASFFILARVFWLRSYNSKHGKVALGRRAATDKVMGFSICFSRTDLMHDRVQGSVNWRKISKMINIVWINNSLRKLHLTKENSSSISFPVIIDAEFKGHSKDRWPGKQALSLVTLLLVPAIEVFVKATTSTSSNRIKQENPMLVNFYMPK